jgi:muramidase (phage lysozyme)
MAKFENLSVDVKKLMSIPIAQRVQVAGSAAGSDIFGSMTPSQIAMLFPKYYWNKVPSLEGAISGRQNRTGGTGGTTRYEGGAFDSSGGTATQAPAKPPVPLSVFERIQQKAYGGLKGGASGVSRQVPQAGRAFLRTLSGKGLEGADYNVIVGGKRFKDFSRHPNEVGVVTAQGPSTAAGRYQFTVTTWRDMQRQYPGEFEDFSPESQDKAAWYLARDDYRKYTKRDLDADLQSKDPEIIRNIGRTLSGRWSSLEGGVHQGSGAKDFTSNYLKNYQSEIEADASTINNDDTAIPEGENRYTNGETDTGIRDGDPAAVSPVPQVFNPELLNEPMKETWDGLTEAQRAEVQSLIEKGLISVEDVNRIAEEHKGESATTVASRIGEIGDNVIEKQQEVAGVRRGEIQTGLKESLSYAAEQAGDDRFKVEVVVTSGGQRMHGAEGATGSHRHDDGGAADFNAYLIDRETNERILLDPRSADHRPYLSKLTTEFSRVHPDAGVGALYMDDPTKIHFGGDDVSRHGGRARGPVAYDGPDWFRESHQQGVVQRSQDLQEGRNVLENWKQSKIEQAAKSIQSPAEAPPEPEPTNKHNTPEGTDTGLRDAPPPEQAPTVPPEQKIMPQLNDTAVPYEDLTVPKLKQGGEFDVPNKSPVDDDLMVSDKQGNPLAMTKSDEVSVPTQDGMKVLSPRQREDHDKIKQIEKIADEDPADDEPTDRSAKPAQPTGQPIQAQPTGQQKETPNSGEVADFGNPKYPDTFMRAMNRGTLGKPYGHYES